MEINLLIVTAVASVLGFLSGLGVGGGSLLLLWLTLILGKDPAEARLMNLLFFLPAAAAACWFRWKQGLLNIRQIIPAALGGCAGAVAGTLLTGYLPVSAMRKMFGILLIATGIRELLYKQKERASG